MKALNLSALAARGRAAEAAHSAKEQAVQAAALRKQLTESELQALKKASQLAPQNAQTVDVLGSISAQSALARLAVAQARAPKIPVVTEGGVPRTLELARGAGAVGANAGPAFTRAFGSNKYALYQSVMERAPRARPLPGAGRYTDGAGIGAASFSVATAIVGGVGLAVGAFLYVNPGAIESMRTGTMRFREGLEAGAFGNALRTLGERMRREDALISQDSLQRASEFAKSIAGSTTPSDDDTASK